MSKKSKFQEGGVMDEDQLYADIDTDDLDGQEGDGGSPLSGEAINTEEEEEEDLDAEGQSPVPGNTADVELNGVEQFLSNYGIHGGMITYDDGTTANFNELPANEQAMMLSTLVQSSTPTLEQKYDLDESEISLLNSVRESGQSTEDFINDLVSHRMSQAMSSKELMGTNYDEVEDDAIFVSHYLDNNPEASDDEVADELVKAKELSSYGYTVNAIRNSYKTAQEAQINMNKSREEAIFGQELEAQRSEVVSHVEKVRDIAGAPITDDMKEFLLGDIMELNDNRDPILMEKIFSDPDTMFKTSWFLNYGEDYIKSLNDYWKKEVSKAHKSAYQKATNGMPSNPTIVPGGGAPKQNAGTQPVNDGNPVTFGKELTEEELFDLENEGN